MPTPSTNADKTPVAPTNRTVVASADETAFALASEVGLGFSPGNKTHRQIGALAPEVCLPVSHKTHHRKLLLSFALAATLITSCEPPKPTPKTTTDNLQLTTSS